MAVRQEVNEALYWLADLGDPVEIENYIADHPELTRLLALEVHRDEYAPILTGLPEEHISRPHHGTFIQESAIFVPGVPYRRP